MVWKLKHEWVMDLEMTEKQNALPSELFIVLDWPPDNMSIFSTKDIGIS